MPTDLRKKFENLPEQGSKYDKRRHEMMNLKPMFPMGLINLPSWNKSSEDCGCGQQMAVLINGLPYCDDCLSRRVRGHI